VRAREGGANTTFFLATHFAKRNTKSGGGKRGWAKIPSPLPTPFSFARPSVGFRFCRACGAAIRDFVQKRFALRSVIATNQSIANFASNQSPLILKKV